MFSLHSEEHVELYPILFKLTCNAVNNKQDGNK